MITRILVNPALLGHFAEKVHEDNLPIEIHEGEKKDELIDVLFEYPDTFQDEFFPLMNNVINEAFGLLEGGES